MPKPELARNATGLTWRTWRAKQFAESSIVRGHEKSWLAGFEEGLEQAASFLEELRQDSAPLALVIRAIGTAKVDENGKRDLNE